jgi:hypothetical protein
MTKGKVHHLPERVPSIRLRHGQTIWLLTELGLRGPASKNTFHEYLKSLRKLGIPFGREKFRTSRRRRLAYYSYYDLMELAMTLSLRVYHVVPDSVINGIARHRDLLHQLFRRAYTQRNRPSGALVALEGHESLVLRGLFLDLNITFAGGHLVRFGPPKLLSALEAARRFGQSFASARPFAPLHLSVLSEQVMLLALNAPTNRRALQSDADEAKGHRRKSYHRRFANAKPDNHKSNFGDAVGKAKCPK